MQVLLDQQHRHPVGLDFAQDVAELPHEQRGQPLGRLVAQQHVGSHAQDPGDRENLLLAAGEPGSRKTPALLQDAERLVDPLQGPRIAADNRRQHQVLLDRQGRVDAAVVGDVAEARAGTLLRCLPLQRARGAFEADPARHLAVQTHHTAQQRGLPRPVTADQRHDLARGHLDRDLAQDSGLAVGGGQALNGEHSHLPSRRR